ncbi:tetratricopeptide repeat protein [Synechocystis sp. PCC 7338]|uniref:O-linked N-acetylglucosamine transferase family protein n=1 Tax=Synechocystis sp. PCC 7338 TaxID=2732530 RepID=UPI001BB000B1|nr:tetratricopeptide repeat protein [Synechocystis sp. PCC 7338]QUS60870.1 tetratricopeptide repeat protein [Synechocystis sp. PCC 7338]
MNNEILKQIKNYLDQEKYEEAAIFLEEKIENFPEMITYYWYLGLVYLLQGEEENSQLVWMSLLLQAIIEEAEQWQEQLIDFLEKQIVNYLASDQLANAKLIYQTIQCIQTTYQNNELKNNLIDKLVVLATGLSRSKNYQEAKDVYLEILDLNPNHAISWHSLALNYYYLGNYQEAEKCILNAIRLDSDFATNYAVLGLILETQKKTIDAINVYQKAIEKDLNLISAYHNLAEAYLTLSQTEEAINIYKKALKYSPRNTSIFDKLFNLLQSEGKITEANLYRGYSIYYSGESGSLYTALGYFQGYYSTLSDEVYPNEVNQKFTFYTVLANSYLMSNKTESAIKILDKASILFPKFHLSLKRLSQSALPILYQDSAEVEFYHQRFQQLLTELIQETKINTPEEKDDFLRSLGVITNFYLSYQSKNDVAIHQQYGDYVHNILKKARPQWCQPRQPHSLTEQRKIRVGYISYRLEGLGLLYVGWLKYCDKNNFEIYVYNIVDSPEDELSGLKINFKLYSDKFYSIPRNINWDDACKKITDDQLDILIFPDLGLDPIFNFLAYLRLAPIQCNSWAHPVTSGSPTIDYFLSSDLMEPVNGDEHYSETLIRLPNLAFPLAPVDLPELDKKRSDFNLGDDRVIYACCQSLFKYLPQHDYIFPAIAQHCLSFQFVFVDPQHGEIVTQDFKKRLDKAFAELDLDYQQYCIFLPRLTGSDFLKLHQLVDIFLDGLSWSGGITTRQAIACGLPIVTCPGEFMRSRHSYGMLKMIDVTETIAQNPEEYIEIAVRLGTDNCWRQQIRDLMEKNKYKLFDDQECIKGLEQFLYNAVISRVV